MKQLMKDIAQELRQLFSGKTLDAIVPPLLFAIINSWLGLLPAIASSIALSIVLGIIRVLKKDAWSYAFFGFLGVGIASLFSFFSQNASGFYLPDIISNTAFLVLTIISLVFKKPLAAYASHLTRGWKLEWFWRDDVRPAYSEVTMLLGIYFLVRSIVLITLFYSSQTTTLALISTISGLPLLIVVLVFSYIYGIARLIRLKGPSVDEFLEGKQAPYLGQRKGF
jgi:hypothetical protein